ncbi:MAG: hypothetical protein U1E39_15820 [Planctomycetota bacterium]
MPYEHRDEPLLSSGPFAARLARHVAVASVLVVASLAIGTVGYHHFARLPWVDAFLNASMILTGMGPVDTLHTTDAKLFAAAYALFSGLAFLGAAGTVVSPILHRVLHHFHASEEDADPPSPTA